MVKINESLHSLAFMAAGVCAIKDGLGFAIGEFGRARLGDEMQPINANEGGFSVEDGLGPREPSEVGTRIRPYTSYVRCFAGGMLAASGACIVIDAVNDLFGHGR